MSISLGLSRINLLLQHLSSPQLKVPIIHVAGTNGKGSVCAYLDSILSQSGLSTGRFNSPHLVTVNDCITICNRPIAIELYTQHKARVEAVNAQHQIEATPFELLTATAYEAFAQTHPALDCAIIETGMGGRDDATNVVPEPLLTILTSIELDHQAFLGDTIEEIATIKAGIIKEGCPSIIAPQKHDIAPLIQRIADDKNSILYQAKTAKVKARRALFSLPDGPNTNSSMRHQNYIAAHLPLQGDYQLDNSSTAVLAAYLLHALPRCRQRVPQLTLINTNSIIDGIERTTWPGRLDWLYLVNREGQKLQMLVDGAHNASSAVALQKYLSTYAEDADQEFIYIIASSAPRDPKMLLEPLLHGTAHRATIIATTFSDPEGMPWVKPNDPSKILDAALECGVDKNQCLQAKDAKEAVEMARTMVESDTGTVVVAAGSLYLVADVMRLQQQGMNGHV